MLGKATTFSGFLKDLLPKVDPITAKPVGDGSLKGLIDKWVQKFGDDQPLRPLKAAQWLKDNFGRISDGSNVITFNQLVKFLNEKPRKK